MDPQKGTEYNLDKDLQMELMPPIIYGKTYMGLEPEMECILKRYNTNMGQERHLEMECS